MFPEDFQYKLLRHLTQEPSSTQRTLAARLGVSVGKVNYCIRALVDRGWLKAKNFRRSDNKLAYAYFLTPTGAAAKLRLTAEFLARKQREYEDLEREIALLRTELTDDAGKSPTPLHTETRKQP